jgi:hypothetical protein
LCPCATRCCKMVDNKAIFPPSCTLAGIHWFAKAASDPGTCSLDVRGSLQTCKTIHRISHRHQRFSFLPPM